MLFCLHVQVITRSTSERSPGEAAVGAGAEVGVVSAVINKAANAIRKAATGSKAAGSDGASLSAAVAAVAAAGRGRRRKTVRSVNAVAAETETRSGTGGSHMGRALRKSKAAGIGSASSTF